MTGIYFLCLVSMVAGIITAFYNSTFCLSAVFFIPMALCFFWQKKYKWGWVLMSFCAGMLHYNSVVPGPVIPPAPVEPVIVHGKILTYPNHNTQITTFCLQNEVAGNSFQEKLRVVVPFSAHVEKGDRIAIKGIMKVPRKAGNPGQFDYPAYLSREGIYYNMTVAPEQPLHVLQKVNGAQALINQMRQKGIESIDEQLPSRESSILLGMLLGKKDGLESEQYGDFQKTGIVHIFAVSGIHIGFIIILCGALFSLINTSAGITFLLTTTIVLIYGTLVGWPVSVIRATIMAFLGLLAHYSGREKNLLNALGLAGIIICIIDPRAPFQLAFQLSFAATFGLIYIFPVIRHSMPLKSWWMDAILVPLSAQLTIIPLTAFYFNLFTPVALLSNILLTYLAGVVVMLGFLSLGASLTFPFLSELLLYPAGLLIHIIIFVVETVKSIPGAYSWVATPPVLWIAFYYLALLLIMLNLEHWKLRRLTVICASIGILFISSFYVPAGLYKRGIIEMVFIDVGQGGAVLIKSPGGKFILIDGGGNDLYDVASVHLMPYLRHRGIRKLAMVINTHPHKDHLQGLVHVVQEKKVERIGIPLSLQNAPEYHDLIYQAGQKKVDILPLHKGQRMVMEPGFSISVLHPGQEPHSGDDYNNDSLILFIEYKKFSGLITGDIEAGPTIDLLSKQQDAGCLVLQVPHHGSKSTLVPHFYDAVNPSYAVVSAGAGNIHGHPHPEVVEMIEQKNIILYRTDRDGAVSFSSDGEKMRIRTFLSGVTEKDH